MTKIKQCPCRHEYQESQYRGKVHNKFKKGWRCTVCGVEKIEKDDDSK